jgi:hypothetical protein
MSRKKYHFRNFSSKNRRAFVKANNGASEAMTANLRRRAINRLFYSEIRGVRRKSRLERRDPGVSWACHGARRADLGQVDRGHAGSKFTARARGRSALGQLAVCVGDQPIPSAFISLSK